jgi:glyoxylase-like metal-dependent hydrolase (beta-lactamase superfamily II)
MDIINIGNLMMNNYLLKICNGYIAIDTGYPGNFDRFCKKLRMRNIELKKIRYILLTHAHDDHAGFLGELLQATDASVIIHKDSPERLAVGHNLPIGGCPTAFAKTFFALMKLVGKGKHEFPAVNVSGRAIVWDGKAQPLREQGIPLDILALPGHTADSIGLLSDNGYLFCGDAAMNGFPSSKRYTIWIENLKDYAGTWDSMIRGNAKTIYPSHGKPFPVHDLIRFRKSADAITLR